MTDSGISIGADAGLGSGIGINFDELSNTTVRLTAHATDLSAAVHVIDPGVGDYGDAAATTAATDFKVEVAARVAALATDFTDLSTNVTRNLQAHSDQDQATTTALSTAGARPS